MLGYTAYYAERAAHRVYLVWACSSSMLEMLNVVSAFPTAARDELKLNGDLSCEDALDFRDGWQVTLKLEVSTHMAFGLYVCNRCDRQTVL